MGITIINIQPRQSPEKEYETLRNELTQGKNYVFERPIVIIAASIALIQYANENYAIYYPIVVIGLLFFNLWFTVNRLESMARIIAYIQLILEDNKSNWCGWETSLRKYRKFMKINKIKMDRVPIDESMIYDNIGFYPTIYAMHIVLTVSVFSILARFTILHCEYNNLVVTFITLGVLIAFLIYALINRPKKIKPNIEKNRVIWEDVFYHCNENLVANSTAKSTIITESKLKKMIKYLFT